MFGIIDFFREKDEPKHECKYRKRKKNKYGRNAVAAGQVLEGKGVYLRTALGGLRRVLPLRGEGLPRIC